jgi:hypothetical protein
VPASSNTGSATLSWGTSTLVTRYVVEQSSNGGTSWTGIYNSSGTSTAISGLADGSYVFHVQACNTYGCSAWVAGSATLVVTHPPTTAPTVSVPATSTNGSYTVSWSGVAGPVSYTLQEQINGGGWNTVQTNGLTNWSTSGRGNGTYGYHVQACNVGGCGPWSSTVTTVVTYPPATAPILSVPGSNSTGSYTVGWGAVSTATSYTLQEQVNAGAWATIQSGNATSDALTGRGNDSYGYRVQACNVGGCGPWSGTGTITVALVPVVPTGITIADTILGKVESYTGSWDAVSIATRYEILRVQTGATVYSGTATSYRLEYGFSPYELQYSYNLRACNTSGCSAWTAMNY